MWQKILWQILWFSVTQLLGVASGLISETINAVKYANQQVEWVSEQKKQYVLDRMVNYVSTQNDVPVRVLNFVLEIAVNYVKSKTS